MAGGRFVKPTNGQIAAAAIRWQAGSDPKPPAEIAGLPTADQVELAREANHLVHVVTDRVEQFHNNDSLDR